MNTIVYRVPLTILTLWLLAAASASAQEPGLTSPLPFGAGPTNAGTHFWFSFPSNYEDPNATVHNARLYITSTVETSVEIYAGGDIRKSLKTVPYDVVTYDVIRAEAQPVLRENNGVVPDDRLYADRAIHIKSDDPIVVYGVNMASFTGEGMLVLPTNALGRRYMAVSAADNGGTGERSPSQLLVTAPYDLTEVTIVPSAATPNHEAGVPFTVTLDQGDVYSVMSAEAEGDLSGSLITATNPVAVTTGIGCAYLPTVQYGTCNHLSEMMLPVESWGTLYHALPFSTRFKGDLFRIFAGEENAGIYINGEHYATLSRVGGERGSGWVEYLPEERKPMTIRSDKPILVMQYSNSPDYDNVEGEPLAVVLPPVNSYRHRILFTTPSTEFPYHYVNIFGDSATFQQIEIASGASGPWEKVALKFTEPIRYFEESTGRRYAGGAFRIPSGTYRLRAPQPVGGYVYGFGNEWGYGSPIALTPADITAGDTVPPLITTVSEQVDGTVDAVASDMPEKPEQRTNLSTVRLDPSSSMNYRLVVPGIEPGITRFVDYRLEVIDKTRNAEARLVAVDMAGNVSYDSALYDVTSGTPVIAATGYDFGGVEIETRVEGTATITNNSSDGGLLLITDIQLPDGPVFQVPGGSYSLPIVVGPGMSRTIPVEFAPQGEIMYRDSLLFSHNDPNSDPVTVYLTGRGTAPVVSAPPLSSVVLGPRLHLTPNPVTSDRATAICTIAESRPFAVDLFDPNGRRVWNIAVGAGASGGMREIPLDLTGLPSGLYFCRLTTERGTAVRPLVLSR